MTYAESQKNRAQRSTLRLYDLERGNAADVAAFPYVAEAPFFSRDGRALYYNANGSIYRMELETRAIARVDTGEADTCNNDHVLSPDGSLMGVSSGRRGDLSSRIYVVDLRGGAARLVTPPDRSYLHGWSPDGRTLAFCAGREIAGRLEWDVYTVPAAGGRETRLTDAPGLDDGPEYSPDGRHIWFNSVRSGLMQVWRMDVDGGAQTQMTFDPEWNAWFPHISPDGRQVVYIAYRRGELLPGEHLPDKNVEIRRIPAAGGREETLLRFFGGQGSMNVNSFSPDGRRFAYVSYSFDET